jgi:hypothetical protein
MMIVAKVATNKFTFGNLLELVGSRGCLNATLEVFNEMCVAKVAQQTSTYNFFIEACASTPHRNVFFLNFNSYRCLFTSRNNKNIVMLC